MKKILLPFLLLSVCYLIPQETNAATLELVPLSQDIYTEESFIADIVLDTEGESVNAVEIDLTFSPDILEVQDVGRGGSVVRLWIKDPSFSNAEGTISFIGGMPGGFTGIGTIGSLTLLAKNAGNTEIAFGSATVLLNDGIGTEATLVSQGKNFLIAQRVGPRIAISTSRHPDQNTWYSDRVLHFKWDTQEGVVYRYILSQDPDAIPNSPLGAPIGDIRFLDVGEGIFYFILTQKQFDDEEFGTASRYRVMIDNTPPEMFDPEVVRINGSTFLVFATTDLVSGVDHYEVLKTQIEGAGVWQVAQPPYLLEEKELRGIIKVKAVDKAGLEQIVGLRLPMRFSLLDGLYLISIFIGLLFVSWFYYKQNKK